MQWTLKEKYNAFDQMTFRFTYSFQVLTLILFIYIYMHYILFANFNSMIILSMCFIANFYFIYMNI